MYKYADLTLTNFWHNKSSGMAAVTNCFIRKPGQVMVGVSTWAQIDHGLCN